MGINFLEPFMLNSIDSIMWPLCRVGGFLMAFMVFSAGSMPTRVRALLALTITVCFLPNIPAVRTDIHHDFAGGDWRRYRLYDPVLGAVLCASRPSGGDADWFRLCLLSGPGLGHQCANYRPVLYRAVYLGVLCRRRPFSLYSALAVEL